MWLGALFVCVLPVRLWPRFEPWLPLRSAAAASGLATAVLGASLGIVGFLQHAERGASQRNAALMRMVAEGRGAEADAFSVASYGMSSVAVFEFLFFTPLGLSAIYLTISGALRAGSSWLGEPYGDFLLTGADAGATTLFERNAADRRRIARTNLEGAEAPDRLFTGEWAGVDADYVVVSSRRKPDWTAGAIVMTSTDWYRLGTPFDLQMPAGLRTAYPLTKLDAVEVVRRGIQYELPRLTAAEKKRPPRNREAAHS